MYIINDRLQKHFCSLFVFCDRQQKDTMIKATYILSVTINFYGSYAVFRNSAVRKSYILILKESQRTIYGNDH